MNTLQTYRAIVDHVTKSNNLAVQLVQDKVSKQDATEQYKALLENALKDLD